MKTKKIFTCIMLIVFSSFSFSQITKFEKNAKDFEFDKLKIGDNLPDFMRRYPSAIKVNNKDEDIGITSYKVDGLKSASYGFFYFFDNKVYLISIVYTKEKLNNIGGAKTLSDRLYEKLGKDNVEYKELEDENKAEILWWDFENIERYFELLRYKDDDIKFLFEDNAIIKKIRGIKAKSANIGF